MCCTRTKSTTLEWGSLASRATSGRRFLKLAQDPEKEVAEWLRSGCPSGTPDSKIEYNGIFPKAERASAGVEQSKTFGLLAEGKTWHEADHENYPSFYAEKGNHAKEEIECIALKGYIDLFNFWENVVAR